MTPGVEMTTGPLGQGLATAVGMALAEKLLAAKFNRNGFPVVDHNTFVFLGDGCLMEGISQEAISLAGVLELDKLVVLYDMNGISIDGKVESWFAEDTPARFAACGWHVIADVDGHDGEQLDAALKEAIAAKKPTLVCCRTVIGYGSPHKSGTAGCHGSPLGADEIAATREALGWTLPPFEIPEDVREAWDARKKGAEAEAAWNKMFACYKNTFPELAEAYENQMSGDIPPELDTAMQVFMETLTEAKPSIATRAAGKNTLDNIAPIVPSLFGMSADLTGSVGTRHGLVKPITDDKLHGNYLSCGVREFGMAALMNGMALHGGFIPYGGTFLVFSDYERSAIRLAALMECRSLFVLTHDSIGVGEDGPTHQPVEHVPSLRLIPNLDVWRPCDAVEVAAAWQNALHRQGPTCLVMTRQNVPTQSRNDEQLSQIARGGYILSDSEGTPELILIATGSEVSLAADAAATLRAEGYKVRVVSMPCTERFDAQDPAYRESVLPSSVRARLAVEAAEVDGWWKYVGLDGDIVGMKSFGASAPAKMLFKHFGITVENIVERGRNLLKK